jgi:hypothetical protein
MKRYGTVSYLIVVRVTPAPPRSPARNSLRVAPLKAVYTPTLSESTR